MPPGPDATLDSMSDSPTTDVEAAWVAAGLLEAVDAATRAVASVLSVDDVLQVIVDQVRPLVGAQYAALGIVDDRGVIERFITSGLSDEARARIGDLPRGHGFLGLIIHENGSFRIRDINTDPRRYGFPPNHPPMTSFLGVPVNVKGRSVGNLYLTNKHGADEFTATDQDLVETFARHAGIAIENARLYEQVHRLAIFDERERIGKDLHDGIIQSIYAVGLSLEDVPELIAEDPDEVVQRVERAIDTLHLTIRDIRNFIMGLRPELLGGTTLLAGVAALVEDFRRNSIVDVEMSLGAVPNEPPESVTSHLLGIVNESLSNIARHSGATRAWIEVAGDERGLTVSVRDNGRGFEVGGVAALGHQGLRNMGSRAADIGAMMVINSAPEQGTEVRVRLEQHPTARE